MADSKTIIVWCGSNVVVSCAKQQTTTEVTPAQLDEILTTSKHRSLEEVPKRTRWIVISGKESAGTDQIYDRLWAKIGNGRRQLSVARKGRAVALIFHT